MLLIVFFGVLPLKTASAFSNIMPVDEVKAGMHGIAKTVVSGTNIEEFDVEVLGVMKNKGPSGDLLLVRVSGDVIDRTGGIAQGMSGSPVYIDGKIVGAIAYGYKFADHRVGMVTPISDMLKLWALPDPLNSTIEQKFADEEDNVQPVTTQIMAAGFSDRALARLSEKLKPFHLVPYAVGDAPENADFGSLEPGSAIGVQLVRGDVSLGALGTVTYVDGDKVLAFGHPFLKKGNVNFLMTNAYVFTTVSGMESSFKVGTTGTLLGTLNQDRGAGIAGLLNKYPGIIPMRITVQDNDLKATREAFVQIVQDEQLAPVFAENTVFNFLDKVMDRIGPGTAKISFEISGRGLPEDVVITRDNMYFNPANISSAVTEEFYEAISLIADNQYKTVDIMDVKVNVEVGAERKTATIIDAQPEVVIAKPGETVNIKVKLKPYRGDEIIRTITYTVPKTQQEGPLTLEVRGGGTIPIVQQLLKQQGLSLADLQPDKNKRLSFAEVIKEFMARSKNNDIVVEEFNGSMGDLAQPNAKPTASLKSEDMAPKLGKKASPDKKNATTIDYIVDGETQVLINVVKDSK